MPYQAVLGDQHDTDEKVERIIVPWIDCSSKASTTLNNNKYCALVEG